MRCAPLCVVLFGLGLSACVAPPTSTARLAESAYDLNEAARFGRMDVALEHVRDTARDEFNRKHARWGKAVRIVDYEVAAVTLRKDGDAEVTVTVNWQRPDETTMRSTELSQRWTDKRGAWWMITEDERGGDPGLLGTAAPQAIDASAMPGLAPPAGASIEGVPAAGVPAAGVPAAGVPTAGVATASAAPPAPRSRYQTRVIYEQ